MTQEKLPHRKELCLQSETTGSAGGYDFIDIFLAFTEPVWFNMISMLKKYQKAVM